LRNRSAFICVLVIVFFVPGSYSQNKTDSTIRPNTSFEVALEPGQAHTYSVKLERGDTALIVIRQIGVDVVVEVNSPEGTMIDSIDSPTGRNGDEIAEVEAAESGNYSIRVRPYDSKEPAGRYHLHFASLHNSRQSAQAIESAKQWLHSNSSGISVWGTITTSLDLKTFDQLAERVHILGIGEATHGSREFGDLRLSLTQRLIERNGYRIVAIEASESRLLSLAPYIRGEGQRTREVTQLMETGWIGRRTQRELVEYVRAWNTKHPNDLIHIDGIDAQDNQGSRDVLGRFIELAYAANVLSRWKEAEKELVAADAQTLVFGDSGVNAATKQFLLEINSMLALDSAVLEARFGIQLAAAKEAASTLLEFADFNSNGEGTTINHSRDWYMANRVLRSLQLNGTSSKVVYWAHNSHVAHPARSTRTAGGLLRDILGCDYGAIGVTFGQGSFVAQIPNDQEDRLAVSMLPSATNGSIEAILAQLRPEASLITWQCPTDASKIPEWLRIPRRMHWVGGLYKPGTNPAEASRPFNLVTDFDGVVYLPRVTADEIPSDRPLIPARKR
jgi:erythromycin esterase